jgi:hypothetical protein
MQNPDAEHLRWKLLGSVLKWLRMWGPHADALEIERGGADIRRLAADAGLSVADLRRMVALGPQAAALLPYMMEALNLDPAATPPEVLRDLQRVCSFCRNKAECTCELARGTADTTYADFCPNADTLRALQREMELWPLQSAHTVPAARHPRHDQPGGRS